MKLHLFLPLFIIHLSSPYVAVASYAQECAATKDNHVNHVECLVDNASEATGTPFTSAPTPSLSENNEAPYYYWYDRFPRERWLDKAAYFTYKSMLTLTEEEIVNYYNISYDKFLFTLKWGPYYKDSKIREHPSPDEYMAALRIYYSNWHVYRDIWDMNISQNQAISIRNEIRVLDTIRQRYNSILATSEEELRGFRIGSVELQQLRELRDMFNWTSIALSQFCNFTNNGEYNIRQAREAEGACVKGSLLLSMGFTFDDDILDLHRFIQFVRVKFRDSPHLYLFSEIFSSYLLETIGHLLRIDRLIVCENENKLKVPSTVLVNQTSIEIQPDIDECFNCTIEQLTANMVIQGTSEDLYCTSIKYNFEDAFCIAVTRRMLSLPVSYNVTRYLEQDADGGTFSSVTYLCTNLTIGDSNYWRIEEYAQTLSIERGLSVHCYSRRDVLFRYIQNIAVNAIYLNSHLVGTGPPFAEAILLPNSTTLVFSNNDSVKYWDENLCGPYDQATRALAFGVGGGQLHGFLLYHHSCLDITSVDLNSAIVDVALQEMDLDELLCSVEPQSTIDFNLSSRSSSICRSRLVINDALSYLKQAVGDAGENEAHLLYDYIIYDIFTSNGSVWHGRTGESTSNSLEFQNVELFELTEALLHPARGIGIFYLHVDGMFPSYLETIKSVFRTEAEHDHGGPNNSRLVYLENSYNSCLVVVLPQLYYQAGMKHPCEDPLGFFEKHHIFNRYHQYSNRISHMMKYSLRCTPFTN